MRNRSRLAWIAVLLAAVLAAAVFAAYRASQQVPQFYADELAVPAATQEKSSDLMLKQATTLFNDLHANKRWTQVFKAETVNGWLAVDLPRNNPALLAPGLRDPRVHIGPDGITLACRVDRGGFHGVVSLEVSPFLESPEVIGLRFHKARLGAIPWALDGVLQGISTAAQKSNVLIRWRQADGDPVALITLPPVNRDRRQIVQIDSIRLEEGSLTVGGTTGIAR